jgi:AcrR family transcriptional regulator
MPRYLTEKDIADFRAELCKVATERFARFGYEGVSMRQLAEALGCSPKTPYRYFKDKADILATVRTQAFAKFADALEAASKGPPAERGRRTSEAYLSFALKNPHAYRIMFDIDVPIDEENEELEREANRAAGFITRGAEEMSKAGVLGADPTLFGWSMWAAIHGLVMLRQSGMLKHGPDHRELLAFLGATMLKGAEGKPRKR